MNIHCYWHIQVDNLVVRQYIQVNMNKKETFLELDIENMDHTVMVHMDFE